ncbi:MAG: pitrilysin family protein [Acidimicrobiales bacterium]
MADRAVDDRVEITELPNGLRIVTERMDSVRSVALGCWVGVGNRDEPDSASGSSHFLEHLLFKGSDRWSSRELSAAIDGIGGDMNAFTSREYTAYSFRVPETGIELAADLLTEVIVRPRLSAEDIDSERLVIREELAMAEDAPDDLVHMELQESLFPAHPLGREVLGTAATIDAIDCESIRAFHNKWYRPSNMVVAAAGNVEHRAVVELFDAAFAGLEPGDRPIREAPVSGLRSSISREKAVEQSHVALGWRGFGLDDQRRHGLGLVNQILGGGLSSRLFHEVREVRGLAYAVFSSLAGYVDAGIFTIYAGTNPENTSELLDVVEAELAKIIAEGFTLEELEIAKGGVAGATMIGLEDSASRMGRLGASVLLRGRVAPLDELLERILAVDLDELNAIAAEVFDADHALSIVGPYC